MEHADHVRLIREAVAGAGCRWADLGSGEGAFTLALADLLGPGADIVSVDLDGRALAAQRRSMSRRFPDAHVAYRSADFTEPLGVHDLDGILMANSLHYVPDRDKERVLGRLIASLSPGGRLVLVEYDADLGNRWVPYPLSYRSWQSLAGRVGLSSTRRTGTVPSRFLGSMFSAASTREPPGGQYSEVAEVVRGSDEPGRRAR